MNDNEFLADEFETIRDKGAYTVRRNIKLINEVLAIKRQQEEIRLRLELEGYAELIRPAA